MSCLSSHNLGQNIFNIMSNNTDKKVDVIDLTQDKDDDSVMEDVEMPKVKVSSQSHSLPLLTHSYS